MKGWYGNKQQHGLASKGIKSRGIQGTNELSIFVSENKRNVPKPYMFTEKMYTGYEHAFIDVQHEIQQGKSIGEILEFVNNEIENPKTSFASLNQGYVMGNKWAMEVIRDKINNGLESEGIVKIKGKEHELNEPYQTEEKMRKTIHKISEFIENRIEELREDNDPRMREYNSGKWSGLQEVSMLLDEDGYYYSDR